MKIKIFDSYIVGKNHYGRGIFAARSYKKGDVVVIFDGPIIHKSKLPKSQHGKHDRYVQVGSEEFMGPSRTTDDLINHSCDPNTGLKFTDSGILLIAIKKIKKNEEITWDYSTTIHNHDWEMNCLCNSKKCRGVIKDFKFLPLNLKRKYLKLGVLPSYLSKTVSIHRPHTRLKLA